MLSSDSENFTMQWIDKHAVQTERLKNQELWEKALELEEKLAHEREGKGKDLQMMENLEHQTQRESTSNDDDAALTTVTDQVHHWRQCVCRGCRLMGQAAYKLDPLKAIESPNGDGFSDITQESTKHTKATASSGVD